MMKNGTQVYIITQDEDGEEICVVGTIVDTSTRGFVATVGDDVGMFEWDQIATGDPEEKA